VCVYAENSGQTSGSSCVCASVSALTNSADRRGLNSGPVPSLRSQDTMAMPRAGAGDGLNSALISSRRCGSHAMMARRLSGTRSVLGADGLRACTKRLFKSCANSPRFACETSTSARAANSRPDSGECPWASRWSSEEARNLASRRTHRRLNRAVNC
jgi:hypothetical protein